METLLMKGKPVADAYRETVSAKITAAKEKGIKVTLAIIVVGDDPASHVYKDRLVKLVESLGGEAKVLAMPETATQEGIIRQSLARNQRRKKASLVRHLHLVLLAGCRKFDRNIARRRNKRLYQHSLRRHMGSQHPVRVCRFRIDNFFNSSPVHQIV